MMRQPWIRLAKRLSGMAEISPSSKALTHWNEPTVKENRIGERYIHLEEEVGTKVVVLLEETHQGGHTSSPPILD